MWLQNEWSGIELAQAKEEVVGAVLPKFEVKDLESLEGKYDTVVCLDVLIHYPQNKADGMIGHLASLAEKRLIISFAPKTFYYDILKRVGELFPGPSKATRAYLHSEADVENALRKVGWKIRKRGLTSTQFYFATLVEAVPAWHFTHHNPPPACLVYFFFCSLYILPLPLILPLYHCVLHNSTVIWDFRESDLFLDCAIFNRWNHEHHNMVASMNYQITLNPIKNCCQSNFAAHS